MAADLPLTVASWRPPDSVVRLLPGGLAISGVERDEDREFAVTPRLEFQILGPFEVTSNGHAIVLPDGKPRGLLALLVLNRNQVVSVDALVDELWADPPATAVKNVQVYVSRLRKALGDGALITRKPGYLLRIENGSVDADCFVALVEEARQQQPAAAAELLRAALQLWRGPPLAEFGYDGFAQREIQRLDELRLFALEERIEADLAVGRHEEVVPELETRVAENPLRERLRGQLMLALHRSGRQAEALEVYNDGRRWLAEELGLEPSDALRDLQRAILNQDPALVPEAVAPKPLGTAAETSDPPRASRRRGRVALIGGGLLLAAAATAAGVGLARRGSGSVRVVPNSVVVVDEKTDRIAADVPVGRGPDSIAVGKDAVWVANRADGTISRIDPRTRRQVKTISLHTDVSDIALGYGSVWVANGNDGTLTRVDPSTNAREETVQLSRWNTLLPPPASFVATGAGGVWVTGGDQLVRVDPRTNHPSTPITIPEPTGLATGAGAVWVTTRDRRLLRISPDFRRRTYQRVDGIAAAPSVGSRAVSLIVYRAHSAIVRVDRRSMRATRTLGEGVYSFNDYPTDLALSRAAAWVVDSRGSVLRFALAAHRAVRTIETGQAGGRPSIALGEGAVWVAVPASS